MNEPKPTDKITWRGSTLLGPLPPTMVSCGNAEKNNVLTVAWTGIINTIPAKTYISVRPERYSYSLIRESGEFVIHLTPASLVRAADWCGVHTGAKEDKFEKCHLTREKASEVSCPLIAESPLALECRVTQVIPLGSHDMFLADVVAVDVDPALLDESGKLDLGRADLCAFAHGAYYELGRQIGTFGFSVRKKNHPPKSAGKKPAKRHS